MQVKKILAIGVLLTAVPGWATIGSAARWGIRTDGNNQNGAFFDPSVGAPGTDYSGQAAAQVHFTDLIIGGTTSTATSVAFPANTASPGNGINIVSGSGCTAGLYEIVSQAAGVYTFDRSLGSAASTCTAYLGGSRLDPAHVGGAVSGNTIYVKSGTYTLTTKITLGTNINLVWIGYGSTYGDNGTKPVITTATNSTALFQAAGTSTTTFLNVSFTNTAATPYVAIYSGNTASGLYLINCQASGFNNATYPFVDSSNGIGGYFSRVVMIGTEVTNSSAVMSTYSGTSVVFVGDYFHGNTVDLNDTSPQLTISRTIFSSSTGAYSLNIPNSITSFTIDSSVFYNAAGPAIVLASSSGYLNGLTNTIFYGNYQAIDNLNTSYGVLNVYVQAHNAYGANTNANANWGYDPSSISLSANPFVSASTGNFALNSTSGGGAALKAAGTPGVFGSATTNYEDIGAAQSAGSGGGSGWPVSGFAK